MIEKITEASLRNLRTLNVPIEATAKPSGDGYHLLISCERLNIKDKHLMTARKEVRTFKSLENLKKVCSGFKLDILKIEMD